MDDGQHEFLITVDRHSARSLSHQPRHLQGVPNGVVKKSFKKTLHRLKTQLMSTTLE